MAKTTSPLLPATARLLSQLGERLSRARRRRSLTALQVANRAGMSTMTLRSIERGGVGVTMGAYLSVLHVLGLDGDLDLVAKQDALGHDLQDAALPRRRGRRTRESARPPKLLNDAMAPPSGPSIPTTATSTETSSPAGTMISSDELSALITPMLKST